MIDIFMKRERHIFIKSLDEDQERPNLRDFGPQDEEDLIIQSHVSSLEKLLPVLNGLIYLKKENREGLYG